MKDLVSIGHACGCFQKDPRLILAMLHSARIEPAMRIDGLPYYSATDVTAAVELLAKTELELDARDRAEAEAPGAPEA